MCTLTICRDGAGYALAMNRDEARIRGPEVPPRRFPSPAGEYESIYPVDSDSGGTWIGFHSSGMTACLLNNYSCMWRARKDRSQLKSRGLIVPKLLDCGGWRSAVRWIEEELDPDDYLPFRLVVISGHRAAVWSWPGMDRLHSWDIESEWGIITSSSWNSQAVERWRTELFHTWLGSEVDAEEGAPCRLAAFNQLRIANWESWSPNMSRPDACTRSIVRVAWDNETNRGALSWCPMFSPPASISSGGRALTNKATGA